MQHKERFEKAIEAFDVYNSNDPHKEESNGQWIPKELLYAMRMTEVLTHYAPHAVEHVRLAARCQHIGRWEIPRDSYPADRKGYLLWRNVLKSLHATIAGQILINCGYDDETIEKVKFIVLKKELQHNAETQVLEDVVCLVFIQYYLEEFATKHEDEKVIDILKKTMKKMSPKAITAVGQIALSDKINTLINYAAATDR